MHREGEIPMIVPASVHSRDSSSTITENYTLEKDGSSSPFSESLSRRSSEQFLIQERAVRELAQTWTQQSRRRQSIYSESCGNPFDAEPGSALDPDSDHFDAYAWTKAMLKLQVEDDTKFKRREAGIAFRDLNAYGYSTGADFQKTVGNLAWQLWGGLQTLVGRNKVRVDILRDLDGVVYPGELLMVLGPPGSGCSTFLKTLAGETHGFTVESKSYLNYSGISNEQIKKHFKGESIYTAEQDVHFPMLTVGKTLYFAARARAPRFIPGGATIVQYSEHMRDVIMAIFGIKHTIDTQVGNDLIHGVSGGERKRVSIAEAALCNAPLQMWDNSTRGLDSANAIEFCRNLRIQTEIKDITVVVAIYQAPQTAYEIFDKVLVLYQGRQIYFGPTNEAKQYFLAMGFQCPDRQTDADFLTSMTSPNERVVKPGFEDKVPRTSDEFAARWRDSTEKKNLSQDIEDFNHKYPIGGASLQEFTESIRLQQAKNVRKGSPYMLSYWQQIKLCLWRAMTQLIADPSIILTQLIGNFAMSLIIASVFYNLDTTTGSFYSRGALLFFAIMMGAFGSALEILSRYSQRPVVEKHNRYALYHPSAEAIASMLSDLPYKIVNAVTFNVPLYFMTNLRRETGAFFYFLLISFTMTLTMSMLFRGVASVSRTLEQALAPASLAILALVMYTGFSIPTTYMLGWARWINYLNPVAYGFESLLINEFSGRNYDCTSAQLLPDYSDASVQNQICSAVGAQPGQPFVEGDTYIRQVYNYDASHRWRNYGILWAFLISLMMVHILTTEFISAKKSKGEVLVWRRRHVPTFVKNQKDDVEALNTGNGLQTEKKGQEISKVIQRHTAIFQWRDVCYDIKIKGKQRRILDNVDGWVKPGTLTALMGVSGAGKTTLLDVLATRVTMGVISGEMLVDGRMRDDSFQRKTGYVQQQDLHLQTSTVREALKFSAALRQPAGVPYKEKVAYVDEVIKLLDMEEYADAVVGVPGEGLNIEQRKRLTIGVELAAKPQLLLFLDEPTSGLDSQTSWSILNLLEKLANNGQAVLCTIHQPSAVIFQRFDSLLLLAKGGKTVYFGPIGESSSILTSYFQRNGSEHCPPDANPAEWMLEVISATHNSYNEIDWPAVWRSSPEYDSVLKELDTMKDERSKMESEVDVKDKANYREFAAPFSLQYFEVQRRVWQQHWRTPTYIYAKISMCVFAALFIGFSFFRANNTMQGLQNQMFGILMLTSIFRQLVQQLMPLFCGQRALYEVRERPSKAYSWKAFMLSNILVEVPWNLICATLVFLCWYYPIGLWRNAEPTDAVLERGGLMWLLIVSLLCFTTSFAHMVIAAVESPENGASVANTLSSLCLVFCGVLTTPQSLPGFWIFMYRVSPFTYLISGMLSTAVSEAPAICSRAELRLINPPSGQTCQEYLGPFLGRVGGTLANGSATSLCEYCGIENTDSFLASLSIRSDEAWRNFGLMWVYIVFNVAAALALYWLRRMPHNWGKKKKN